MGLLPGLRKNMNATKYSIQIYMVKIIKVPAKCLLLILHINVFILF